MNYKTHTTHREIIRSKSTLKKACCYSETVVATYTPREHTKCKNETIFYCNTVINIIVYIPDLSE